MGRGTGHGTWGYRLELPKTGDGRRRQLRRAPAGPVNSREAALAEHAQVVGLLDLAGSALRISRPQGRGRRWP